MKSKLFLLAAFTVSALALSSCGSDTSSEIEFTGIWAYTNIDGDYAELWVTDESLLAIRNPEQRPGVFDYLRSGDTVKIYAQDMAEESRTPLDQFYLKSREGDNLTKTQDGHTTVLTLADATTPKFDDTAEFKQKVLSDFNTRAAQK